MAREVTDIAPWAELVPDAPYPMSLEEFERWPEEPGWRYELVEGRLVRMGEGSPEHALIVKRIMRALDNFVEPRGLGQVYPPAAFVLPQPGQTKGTEVGPDVAFVARGRGPKPGTPEHMHPSPIAPDLVAEVASPESNQYRPEMEKKVQKYLDAGTRLVWVAYPQWNEVDVWWHGERGHESQTLKADQQIDGRDVLPGFTHPVGRFFPALDERRPGIQQNHTQDFDH